MAKSPIVPPFRIPLYDNKVRTQPFGPKRVVKKGASVPPSFRKSKRGK